eukprot:TRINITY_DN4701_c0_g1_i1.p1 TRINITY_DN4701_c0_g1~~TRINITY_DN4701_c0_g1_i1.p1  ORF type:complete len:385 (+),score=113.01 TRINITY_DN4701_c0_g1_i1:96-1157(+)
MSVLTPRCVLVEDDPEHRVQSEKLLRNATAQREASDAAGRRVAVLRDRAADACAACRAARELTLDRNATAVARAGDARLKTLKCEMAQKDWEAAKAESKEAKEALAAAQEATKQAQAAQAPLREAADRARDHLREMEEAARWPRSWRKRVSHGKASVSSPFRCEQDKRQAELAEADAVARLEEAEARVSAARKQVQDVEVSEKSNQAELSRCKQAEEAARTRVARAAEREQATQQCAAEAEAEKGAADRALQQANADLERAKADEAAKAMQDDEAAAALRNAQQAAARAEQAHDGAMSAYNTHAASPRRHRVLWEPGFASPQSVGSVGHLTSPSGGGDSPAYESRTRSPPRLR